MLVFPWRHPGGVQAGFFQGNSAGTGLVALGPVWAQGRCPTHTVPASTCLVSHGSPLLATAGQAGRSCCCQHKASAVVRKTLPSPTSPSWGRPMAQGQHLTPPALLWSFQRLNQAGLEKGCRTSLDCEGQRRHRGLQEGAGIYQSDQGRRKHSGDQGRFLKSNCV